MEEKLQNSTENLLVQHTFTAVYHSRSSTFTYILSVLLAELTVMFPVEDQRAAGGSEGDSYEDGGGRPVHRHQRR